MIYMLGHKFLIVSLLCLEHILNHKFDATQTDFLLLLPPAYEMESLSPKAD